MRSMRSIKGSAVGFAFGMYFLALRVCVILRVLGSVILVVGVVIMCLVFAIFYFAFDILSPSFFGVVLGAVKSGVKSQKAIIVAKTLKCFIKNLR